MSESSNADASVRFSQVGVGSFFYCDGERYVRIPPVTTALGHRVNAVNIKHRHTNHLFRAFADDHPINEIEPREI